MYNCYVTRLGDVRPHPNADKLKLGTCFGSTVCVSLDYEEGQLGVYFPSGGQLSEEFCQVNDLIRRKDEDGNPVGGYLEPEKRNVRAIRLRGVESDGIFLPLNCLESFGSVDNLVEGELVSTFNGEVIAQKYIPRSRAKSVRGAPSKEKPKTPIAPLFREHSETKQLRYYLSSFHEGDVVDLSLKMHGTSQRTGYLPVLKGYKRSFLDFILRRAGKPIYGYDYVVGTRRTVLENFEGGYYGNDSFRKTHHDKFIGKLQKGETVYYEVVGFTDNGTPIMGVGNNKKLGKEFTKRYGDKTVFSYGCDPEGATAPRSECYVYRMTLTNEDGYVVEYTPELMRIRCAQLGVKSTPHLDTVILGEEPERQITELTIEHSGGDDLIDPSHIREGVVIRIANLPEFTAYKDKNFEFKVLDGIIKDAMEEEGKLGALSEDILEEM